MLYDPKWEVKTKPDPMSLNGLIAWLETRDPKERYNYVDCQNCLLSQYFRSLGMKVSSVGPYDYRLKRFWIFESRRHRLPRDFNAVANGGRHDGTFGRALERARELAAA